MEGGKKTGEKRGEDGGYRAACALARVAGGMPNPPAVWRISGNHLRLNEAVNIHALLYVILKLNNIIIYM